MDQSLSKFFKDNSAEQGIKKEIVLFIVQSKHVLKMMNISAGSIIQRWNKRANMTRFVLGCIFLSVYSQ